VIGLLGSIERRVGRAGGGGRRRGRGRRLARLPEA
jgi:hypothetical protein